MTPARVFALGRLYQAALVRERICARTVEYYSNMMDEAGEGRHFQETCLEPAKKRWEKAKALLAVIERKMRV